MFGSYPTLLTRSRILCLVASPTAPVLLTTCETVAIETPANLATSRIVGRAAFKYLSNGFKCSLLEQFSERGDG